MWDYSECNRPDDAPTWVSAIHHVSEPGVWYCDCATTAVGTDEHCPGCGASYEDLPPY